MLVWGLNRITMANQFVSGAGKFAGRGFGGIFGHIFRFGFTYIFIIILFIQILSVGISNGWDVSFIINELGGRFVGMTQNLQRESLNIIDNGAVFSGYLEFIWLVGKMFFYSYGIFLWIKLFYKAWGWSPISDDSAKARNLVLGILTFLTLQIFYNFVFSQPLAGQTYLDLFYSPILAFRDFFQAVILLFSSTSFDRAVGAIATELNNSCADSVCVI